MSSRWLNETRKFGETRFSHPGSLVSGQFVLAIGLQGRKIENLELFFAGDYDSVRGSHVGSGRHAFLGFVGFRQRHTGPVKDCDSDYGRSMLQLYLLAQCTIDIFFRSSYTSRYSQREDVNRAVIRARPKCRCCILYCKYFRSLL